MNLRPLFLTALLALGGSLCLGSTVWTVDEAVAMALRQNPDAQLSRYRIDAAQAMIQQADSAWKPQFVLTGGYTTTNNALVGFIFTMYQRSFSQNLNFNRQGWVDDLNLVGTVYYNLYSGGRATACREAARAGTRAAEQDLLAVQNQLATEVVKAMLTLRKARETVTSLEAGLQAYEASVANSRLRFEAGQVLKADLLSLEVQTARTREMLSTARNGAALAARVFTFILGAEATEDPIELAANDPALTGLAAPEAVNLSLHPEILALEERIHAAESMVEAARGGRRVNITAYANAQFDQGWHFNRRSEHQQAGIVFDFNVFDGGRTSGQILRAQADLAQAKEQLRKSTLSLGLAAEQARLAHKDASERVKVTESALAQAEESAALSRARFEKGALLTSELIGSESRLIEMRMSYSQAIADERRALIELRYALGIAPVVQL